MTGEQMTLPDPIEIVVQERGQTVLVVELHVFCHSRRDAHRLAAEMFPRSEGDTVQIITSGVTPREDGAVLTMVYVYIAKSGGTWDVKRFVRTAADRTGLDYLIEAENLESYLTHTLHTRIEARP